jgi:hypothetical protein
LNASCGSEDQQRPFLMVLSVQLAAEEASAAAPRTVLQAASARHVPIKSAVVTFDFIITLPYVSGTR